MAPYYVTNQDDPDRDYYPTVARVTPRCPKCDATRSRVIGQSRGGGMRYHRCIPCGLKFRSLEVDPPPLAEKKT